MSGRGLEQRCESEFLFIHFFPLEFGDKVLGYIQRQGVIGVGFVGGYHVCGALSSSLNSVDMIELGCYTSVCSASIDRQVRW